MTEREKHDPSQPTPEKKARPGANKRPFTPDTPGRAKRGSDFRDADLFDAPVEDPEDHIPPD